MGYARKDEDGHEVAIAATDVACVTVEAEIANVLSGKGQLCAEQTDGP